MATQTKKTQAPSRATKPARAPKASGKPARAPKAAAETSTVTSPLDAVGRVLAIHSVLSSFDAAAARALEINRSDLACLRVLANGPQKARALSTALGLTSGSITALLDRLENDKLIRRAPSTTDRRAIDVELTPASARRLAKVYEGLEQSLRAATSAHKKANLDSAEALLADLESATVAALAKLG
jgi:DNA-binding MarR family transcriptional regulator